MIRGLAKLAFRNTVRRGRKSWITVIGVFIGIAAVVSLVSLGQGLEASVQNEFEELGSNQVLVSGEITDSDISVVESARGVDEAVRIFQRTDAVTFRGETKQLTVVGADLNKFETAFNGLPLRLENGRKLRGVDRTSAMIGLQTQSFYEERPEIRSQLKLGDRSFRVQGIYSSGSPQFQNSMIISLQQAREVWELEDELTQIVAVVDEGFSQEEVANNIEETMRRDRGLKEGDENFSATTPQDVLEALTGILGVIQGVVVGLASIALLVGGIGIMNTMYMSINERTQEIGVLKAIGASRRQIRMLFLMESSLIGLIGGVIGVIIGLAITELASIIVAQSQTPVGLATNYSPLLIISALLFSTALGLVSGYLPSRSASNLEPAEALRYE